MAVFDSKGIIQLLDLINIQLLNNRKLFNLKST